MKKYTHMSKVPYTSRQGFKISERGDNRDVLEITQGGNLIWIETHCVYGGYYQGKSDTQLDCGSERMAKRLYN